jgi:hypothetical protein
MVRLTDVQQLTLSVQMMGAACAKAQWQAVFEGSFASSAVSTSLSYSASN